MSTIKEAPIQWKVQRLMCDCGGEFTIRFTVKDRPRPYTHVCSGCSALQDLEIQYPKTVWEEVCQEKTTGF